MILSLYANSECIQARNWRHLSVFAFYDAFYVKIKGLYLTVVVCCHLCLHRKWSHSYLRALCSSSICSLTVFSSFSRATSVPFTHVYTTSIGIGRQSLQKKKKNNKTHITLDGPQTTEPWPCFPQQHTENLFFSHAWLHLLQYFRIYFKWRVQTGQKWDESGFLQEVGSGFAHISLTFALVNIIRL